MIILPSGGSCQKLGASLEDMKSFALAEIDWPEVSSVVSGIEPGWDQAVALTAIDLGVFTHIVIPYYGWEERWSKSQQKKCQAILSGADIVDSWTDKEAGYYGADLRLGQLTDAVLVLGQEHLNSARASVATHRKARLVDLWPAWIESGMVIV